MAKLKIFTFPDPILSQKALPIAHIDKSFQQLAEDMLETMYDAPGVGLAANQVGVLQRILVIDTEYDFEELPEGSSAPSVIKNKKPRVILNPQIISCEGSISFSEGCLSVPEFTAEVDRSEKLKLQYQDLDGVTQTLSADGLLAVAIQHEIDHLDGKLFIDRLSPIKKEIVKKRLKKERLERESSGISAIFRKKEKGF